MKCYNLNPLKTYVQFNDLVIDSADELSSASLKQDTKTETQEYSYGHGSYVAFHKPQLFLSEGDLSLTLNLNYMRFHHEDRRFIRDYINLNLLKPGRLWAIQDNKLIWAWAYVTGFNEDYKKYQGFLSIDVDFKLWEGVWHIADTKKTFLVPYSVCNILDCEDFRDPQECISCCESCPPDQTSCGNSCLCDCGDIVKETSLCVMGINTLENFMNCGESYKIVYDCAKGEQIFGDDLIKNKVCKKDYCTESIAGRFYSGTILDTDKVTLILDGKFQDPEIDINGNKILIKGEYDGILTLDSSCNIYFTSDGCCSSEEVDLDNLVIENEFGFTVHHGMNRIIVTGACCKMACVYIDVDELTN